MLLLGGRPILDYAIGALHAVGVARVTIVTGEHGGMIQSYFQDGARLGMAIDYVHQGEPKGTADAVRLALNHVSDDAVVWVVPGHMHVSDGTFANFSTGEGTVVLAAVATANHDQGVLEVEANRLRSIHRMVPVPGATRVSTGIVRLGMDVRAGVAASTEPDLDRALSELAKTLPIKVRDAKGPVDPVVDAWGLLALNEHILDNLPNRRAKGLVSGPVRIGESTVVSPTAQIIGPVVIGEGCHIGDRAVVGPYVSIRNNSVIGAQSEVRRAIINNNVLVDSRSVVRSSILDDGAQLGVGFLVEQPLSNEPLRGCIVGSDATIGGAVLARPGAIVEPGARIEARATLGDG